MIRGVPQNDSFSAFYLKDGVILAADTVNRPSEFMLAKRFIAEKIKVDVSRLADDTCPLKDLLPAS
ncbi:Putidaredoxin reductase [compost metagenome]